MDDDLFTKIYQAHRQSVIVYLYRETKNRADSEDLAQEAFLRLWTWNHEIKNPEKINGLLIRLARNSLVDWRRLRSTKKRRNEYDAEPLLNDKDYTAQSENPEIQYRLTQLFDTCMKESSTGALYLRHRYGFDNAEIAEYFKESRQQTDSRIYREKHVLAEIFKHSGIALDFFHAPIYAVPLAKQSRHSS